MVDNTWSEGKLLPMTLLANALTCERNGRVIFRELSFEVKNGHCAELRGPNGSGKSSLLRLIAGLLPATAGTLSFRGQEASAIPQLCHFIAHQDAVKWVLTVSENLEFWSAMLGGADIAGALSAFALEPLRHEQAAVLSAGQRRRLALSRLFLVKRPLWLLDEPSSALDGASVAILKKHMQAHLAEGGMILSAAHDDLLNLTGETIALGSAAS
jgi:heme exporter protein A